jgi:hypothetical protein
MHHIAYATPSPPPSPPRYVGRRRYSEEEESEYVIRNGKKKRRTGPKQTLPRRKGKRGGQVEVDSDESMSDGFPCYNTSPSGPPRHHPQKGGHSMATNGRGYDDERLSQGVYSDNARVLPPAGDPRSGGGIMSSHYRQDTSSRIPLRQHQLHGRSVIGKGTRGYDGEWQHQVVHDDPNGGRTASSSREPPRHQQQGGHSMVAKGRGYDDERWRQGVHGDSARVLPVRDPRSGGDHGASSSRIPLRHNQRRGETEKGRGYNGEWHQVVQDDPKGGRSVSLQSKPRPKRKIQPLSKLGSEGREQEVAAVVEDTSLDADVSDGDGTEVGDESQWEDMMPTATVADSLSGEKASVSASGANVQALLRHLPNSRKEQEIGKDSPGNSTRSSRGQEILMDRGKSTAPAPEVDCFPYDDSISLSSSCDVDGSEDENEGEDMMPAATVADSLSGEKASVSPSRANTQALLRYLPHSSKEQEIGKDSPGNSTCSSGGQEILMDRGKSTAPTSEVDCFPNNDPISPCSSSTYYSSDEGEEEEEEELEPASDSDSVIYDDDIVPSSSSSDEEQDDEEHEDEDLELQQAPHGKLSLPKAVICKWSESLQTALDARGVKETAVAVCVWLRQIKQELSADFGDNASAVLLKTRLASLEEQYSVSLSGPIISDTLQVLKEHLAEEAFLSIPVSLTETCESEICHCAPSVLLGTRPKVYSFLEQDGYRCMEAFKDMRLSN